MIAIVDYNAGNVRSVANALARLGASADITADPERIRAAEKVIFPGVGAAGSAMQELQQRGLDRLLPTLKQPVLGICLGMQLMCRRSEEDACEGLGIFPADVRRFPKSARVPHMGWNGIRPAMIGGSSPILRDLPDIPDFYFVHSYFAECCPATVATCDYVQPFSACLQSGNFFGTQFHPEKSGDTGEILLRNFLQL